MTTTTFLDLQNGFYNALSQGLGFSSSTPFQMVQPSPPLAASTTQNPLLWDYFNSIPPDSLTHSYVPGGGAQFAANYAAMLSALISPTSTFAADVGADCNARWLAHLNGLTPTPSLGQWPGLFREWAMMNGFEDVANKGSTDLSDDLLDPIAAAGMAMSSYAGKPYDWDAGYNDLVQQLAAAPSRAFTISSSSMNLDVTSNWANNDSDGFFGLWGGSDSSSSESSTFAESDVTVTANFDHVTQFAPVPGTWYNSAAMALAFENQTGAPWKDPNAAINWGTTFGPGGDLQRFAVNLIVVTGMTISVTSNASFSTEQQSNINNNSGAGMWPFYDSDGSSGSASKVHFGQDGSMTVTIASTSANPIVIGVIVEPIAQFAGPGMRDSYTLPQAA